MYLKVSQFRNGFLGSSISSKKRTKTSRPEHSSKVEFVRSFQWPQKNHFEINWPIIYGKLADFYLLVSHCKRHQPTQTIRSILDNSENDPKEHTAVLYYIVVKIHKTYFSRQRSRHCIWCCWWSYIDRNPKMCQFWRQILHCWLDLYPFCCQG